MAKPKWLIGIDEVGRGPIAGPVTLGAFLISQEKKRSVLARFARVKESKQLTPTQREEWFEKIMAEKRAGNLDFAVSFVSSEQIDKLGLSRAIRLCLRRSIMKLTKGNGNDEGKGEDKDRGKNRGVKHPTECRVLLDGSLAAPKEFTNQETIIGGDACEPVIALASICAKVLRDRRLVALARKYPQYDFHIHKGYGTAAHYKKIRQHGMCPIHRRSFLKSLVSK